MADEPIREEDLENISQAFARRERADREDADGYANEHPQERLTEAQLRAARWSS